jgi:uncharacterized membrane protein
MNGADNTAQFSPEDIQKNKVVAAFAYLIFFLPLLASPDSAFARFHANQGLLLLLTSFAGSWVLGFIPLIGWMVLPLFLLAICVLAVLGFANAYNGKAQELPVIGRYRILQ